MTEHANLATLPMATLVDVHNVLTKNTVKKFENRTKATRRITELLKNSGGMSLDQALKEAGHGDQAEADAAQPGPIDPTRFGMLAPRTGPEALPAPPANPDDSDPIHEDKADTDASEAGRGDKIEDDARTTYTGGERTVSLTDPERAAIVAALMQTTANLTERVVVSVLEKLRTAQPATTKAPRAAKAKSKAKAANPRSGGMTGHQRTMIDLCSRPEGATGKELAEACGWPSIAARATITKLAERFNLDMTETPKTGGRGISFRLQAKA